MTAAPDVLVVGCGAVGLSVAYNLALRGLRVLAVDRVGSGAQTSAKAAGQSVIAHAHPAMGALMHRSIERIITFEDGTGVLFAYHQVGSVKYALADWSAAQLDREVKRARRPDVLTGFAVGRFADRNLSPDEIWSEALAQYEGIYSDAETAGHVRRYGAPAGALNLR